MSKNTNLSFLTDYITADITNGRIGINNASPSYAFDVTGTARTSTSTYLATAGGNVGIGSTTPGSKLTVLATDGGSAINATNNNSTAYTTSTYLGISGLVLFNSNTSTGGLGSGIIMLPVNTGGAGAAGSIGTISLSNANASSALVFQTRDTSGNDGERMRIASAGNIGIGTTSPSSQLHIAGSTDNAFTDGLRVSRQSTLGQYVSLNYAGGIVNFVAVDTVGSSPQIGFYTSTNGTSGTERMRISANGNVGIGTTGSGRTLSVYTTTATQALFVHNSHNTNGDYGLTMQMGPNTNNASSYYMFCDTDAVGVRMVVYGNGNLANINGSYGAYSDIKLKENIIDATPKLEDLLKVKVRNYNLKTDPSLKQIGIIAQELEEVFPGLIEESNDTIKDEETGEMIEIGTTTKSIKYSVFIPMLIKAIQELKAEIDTLKNK